MRKINIFKKLGRLNVKAAEKVSQMPPLPHSIPGQPFDINNSAAARWVTSLPEVMQIVWDMAHTSGTVKYDPETGCWAGVHTIQPPYTEDKP